MTAESLGGTERTFAATDLEYPACPVCDAGPPTEPNYRHGVFAVVRRGACRLRYLSPRLTEEAMTALDRSASYYTGGQAGYDDYSTQEPSLRATFRRLLGNLSASGMTGGSLLEVGCGHALAIWIPGTVLAMVGRHEGIRE